MKRWKTLHKLLALVLALNLSLSLVSVPAFAADEEEAGDGRTLICEKEEHTHTDECYAPVTADDLKLICTLDEGEGHTHTEACGITTEKELACGLEESDGHTHTDECEPETTKELTCGKEESEGHKHTDECYGEPVTELTCGQEEAEAHTHTDDCYHLEPVYGGDSGVVNPNDPGAPGIEEPDQGQVVEEYVPVLDCGKEETEGHTHTDECYTTTTPLICGQEESEGHKHTDECYTETTTYGCGLEEAEGHTHTPACYDLTGLKLACEKPEHTHVADCYDAEGNLVCTTEEHTHTVLDCYQKLACGKEEHTHTDECYEELPQGNPTDGFTGGPLKKSRSVTGTWKLTSPIEIPSGCSVTLDGNGTIDASGLSGDKASAIIAGKTRSINGAGDVTIKGGKGTNFTNSNMEPRGNNTFKVGGGVYVKKGGTLNLEGGTITGNTAQRGGGIFINNGANFTMTGGTVSGNQTVDKVPGDNFAGEGGGIFVYGTATISGGQIINNTCNSKTDLGGGGLYVNNSGLATLINATVTGNTADGFGGGIAGCCHGEASLVATDGVALYGNTANGTSHTLVDGAKGDDGVAEIIDHYSAASKQGITGANSTDFYTAGSAIISNYMAGGGSSQFDVKAGSAEPTRLSDAEVKKYENTNVALVANPSEESKNSVPGGVLISGNTSTVHGGGIGCNGGLYFGSAEDQTFDFYVWDLSLDATKSLTGGSMKKDDFSFELYYGDKKVATAKNDENGKIIFNLSEYADLSWLVKAPTDEDPNRQTVTFRMKEVVGDKENIVYDKSEYEIVLEIEDKVETKTETLKHTTDGNKGFKNITVKYNNHKLSVKNKTITKVVDEFGNKFDTAVPVEKIEFVNKNQVQLNFSLLKYAIVNGERTTVPVDGATFKLFWKANDSEDGYKDVTGLIVAPADGNLVTKDGKVDVTVGIDPNDYESKYKDGSFYFQEVEAPAGFKEDKTSYYLAGSAVDKTGQCTVYNEGVWSAKFKKTDITGTDSIENAKFDLYFLGTESEDTKVLVKSGVMSGEGGKIVLEGLIPGIYELAETAVPEGSGYATSSFKFKLNGDNDVEVIGENWNDWNDKTLTYDVVTYNEDGTESEPEKFYGIPNDFQKANLTISKTVNGEAGKGTSHFEFSVELTLPSKGAYDWYVNKLKTA